MPRSDPLAYTLVTASGNATGAAVVIRGGLYMRQDFGTFGGGNTVLQILGADNSTWIPVGAAVSAAAASGTPLYLPGGQVRAVVAGGAANSVDCRLVGIG